REGPGDLDELAERQRQSLDRRFGIDRDAHTREDRLGAGPAGAPEAEPGGRLAEEEIVGDRERPHERQLLVNRGDPCPRRVARMAERGRGPIDDDLAVVIAERAREDPDEGALSGAVAAR